MSHVGKLQQLNRFQIRCYNEYNKTSQMTTNSMWPKFKVFLLLKIHSLLLSLFWYYFSLRLCINTVAWKMSPRSFVFLFSNKTKFSSQKNYFCLSFCHIQSLYFLRNFFASFVVVWKSLVSLFWNRHYWIQCGFIMGCFVTECINSINNNIKLNYKENWI